jgi:putative DNA primase/helicase
MTGALQSIQSGEVQRIIAAEGSQIDIADRFAEDLKERLRYVMVEKKWFSFDGKCWREDTTGHVRDMIKEGLARISICVKGTDAYARSVASYRTLAGVEQIAQVDRRLAATVEQWDADPALLCTPGGIVDLIEGTVRPAKPEDYCRKMTSVVPAEPGTPISPYWRQVLGNLASGDQALERYYHKLAGYCLFGEQREKAFFIPVGETDSGKTTAFETWLNIMGDYASSATVDTFLEDPKGIRSTNDLAELNGYRMVIAAEPDKSRRLSATRLKRMVGNDTDRNRRLYQSGSAGRTTYKVILHCNDVPHLGEADPALENRLHIIPAGKTIPPEKKDRDLLKKLEAEHPVILRWMIEGCALWLKEGLDRPHSVMSKSDQYFKSENPISRWIEVRIEADPLAPWISTETLYQDYRNFTLSEGAHPLPKEGNTGFAKRLKDYRWKEMINGQIVERGFEPKQRNTGSGFSGIDLKPTHFGTA